MTTMPTKNEDGNRPLVLIMDNHEWSARALESVLTANGWMVQRVRLGRAGLAKVREQQPNLVFIGDPFPGGTALEFCRALKDDPSFSAAIPVIVTTPERPSRRQRLAVLEAGAWEVLTHPLDAEEIVCKLRTYGRAKSEIDRLTGDCLVDQLTGLYSRRGLERRALEMSSVARRTHQGLACVAMTSSTSHDEDWDAIAAAAKRAAEALKPALRASDALGRLRNTEFAVFTPITDAEGPVKLVHRLADAIRSQDTESAGEPGFELRAGYDAVSDAAETPTEDLLLHATLALRQAKTGSTGDWICSFEADSGTA